MIQKGKGRMPAFPLPASGYRQTGSLYPIAECDGVGARRCRAMRRPARRFSLAAEQCSTCHVVRGRGTSAWAGPVEHRQQDAAATMQQVLANPGANITPGYAMASVRLNDGTTLRGFLRAQGSHDVVLQTKDGKLHPLVDSEYKTVTQDQSSAMGAFRGTAEEQRDLLAYLSTLNGVGVGALKQAEAPVRKPRSTRWSIRRKGTGRATTGPWMGTGTAHWTRSIGRTSASCSCSGIFRDQFLWAGDDAGGGGWGDVCDREQPGVRVERKDGPARYGGMSARRATGRRSPEMRRSG